MGEWRFLFIPLWYPFFYTKRCIIEKAFRQISLFSILHEVFRRGLQVFCFSFFHYTVKFIIHKVSLFNVLLTIDNFFSIFLCDFRWVSTQILKVFFLLLKSFFGAGSFLLWSWGPFPTANFIYCSEFSIGRSSSKISTHLFDPLMIFTLSHYGFNGNIGKGIEPTYSTSNSLNCITAVLEGWFLH